MAAMKVDLTAVQSDVLRVGKKVVMKVAKRGIWLAEMQAGLLA